MQAFQFLDKSRAAATVRENVAKPLSWIVDDEVIQHATLNFFKIFPTRDEFGVRRIMIEQKETALVGLLVSRIEDETYLLISSRCEPGLHNLCQLTSTIQSTPTNYLQKHGGAETPFINYFFSDRADSKVIHESSQFDWGNYYLGKIKNFKIIQIENLLEVKPPYFWIKYSDFLDLLDSDYSITTDLRSLTVALESYLNPKPIEADRFKLEMAEIKSFNSKKVEKIKFSDLDLQNNAITDDLGRTITWVKFDSDIREIKSWEQPLVKLPEDLIIDLWTKRDGSTDLYAVRLDSQVGLLGKRLLFPGVPEFSSDLNHAQKLIEVITSAEGGRFFRHGVNIRVFEATSETFGEHNFWLEREQLFSLGQKSLLLSLELRLALSLVLNLEHS